MTLSIMTLAITVFNMTMNQMQQNEIIWGTKWTVLSGGE
jgi:hypothetical protein